MKHEDDPRQLTQTHDPHRPFVNGPRLSRAAKLAIDVINGAITADDALRQMREPHPSDDEVVL